jgi:hypothetical protein
MPAEVAGPTAGALEDLGQQPAVEVGLAATDIVERDVP